MITINKIVKNPSTALFPVPTVLVSCEWESELNIITIAWTGIMNSNPPMVYIGVQPVRHSYNLIKESGAYVINIPSASQAKVVDYCGVVSGRDTNKFRETGLTPVAANIVKAPLIKECPVNIECQIRHTINLGSHDVFIAEVAAIHYDEIVLKDNGQPDFDKLRPYGFCMGEYRLISEKIGSFGFSGKVAGS